MSALGAAPAWAEVPTQGKPVSPVAVGTGPHGLPWSCTVDAVQPVRLPAAVVGAGVAVCTGDFEGVHIRACIARAYASAHTLANYVPGFDEQACQTHEMSTDPVMTLTPTAACPLLTDAAKRFNLGSAQETAGAPWVTYILSLGSDQLAAAVSGAVSEPAWIPACGTPLPPVT